MILPSNIAKIRKHLVILFEMKTLSHSLSPPMCTISAPNGHRPSCDTCVSFQFRFHLALCYLCHTKTNRHSATDTLEQTAKKRRRTHKRFRPRCHYEMQFAETFDFAGKQQVGSKDQIFYWSH